MLPFLSTSIGWIFIPAICALAGFVPWADLGIRQTLEGKNKKGIKHNYKKKSWRIMVYTQLELIIKVF